MTQRNNILQELKELNSPLASYTTESVYSVPEGYFEGLAATVLSRIRAMNAVNSTEEIKQLSPFIGQLSAQMPYSVPAGYFEELPERMLQRVIAGTESLNAKDETTALSPLLGSLKKTMPYSVPEGYFEQIKSPAEEEKTAGAKIISIGSRNWFRYAAAAVVTGIIAIAGFLILNSDNKKPEGGKALAKVSKDIKKMNPSQQEDLIDFLDAGLNGTETAQVKTDNRSQEIKQLLKDIPEEELKIFQEQTEDIEDVLMIN